jgi:molybdopterin-guanine dinucleotide biosynthesis protein A
VADRLPVVVLAGGNSRRFRGDKLRAQLDGQSVLARVVDRVSPIASEVFLATSSEARAADQVPELPSTVRALIDRPERWGHGPAAAMASARSQLGDGPILFVPGDVPWIEANALGRLVTRASQSPAEVAVPVWSSGETEHLLQWQRNATALSHLPWFGLGTAPGSWRASEFLRAVPRTLVVPVGALTSRPGSFAHVTYHEDLLRPAPRGESGPTSTGRIIEGLPKRWYATAHTAQFQGDSARAARAFTEEGRWYRNAGLALLGRHAAADAARTLRGNPRGTPLRVRSRKLTPYVVDDRVIDNPVGE